MKHKLKQALATAALLLCSMVAMAQTTATVGGITYEFITKAKLATVVKSEGGSYTGNIVIPETVKYDGVAYSVTTIGVGAFSGCDITSITIPNSVTEIGDNAFYNCTGLTSITIPNSVTTIGDYAFYGCSGLTSITIPNSVTTIGDYAFYGCSGLTNVVIGDGVTTIGQEAFRNCTDLESITIGNSVTKIGIRAFWSTNLTAVHIKNLSTWCNIDFSYYMNNASATAFHGHPIGNRYRYGYAKLKLYLNGNLVTDLVIPNDVTEIKDNAFWGFSSITSITIPNSVTTIGFQAFSGCNGITSITIPSSVTTIRNSAFWDCDGITAVHISDLSAWCNIDFGGDYSNPLFYAHKLYLNGELVTNLTIPNDVTEIKEYAFYGCSGLTSISIPNSVTTIGDYAFYGCSSLTSVTIPNSVTTIGTSAFNGCSDLTSITIPNSVTTIGNFAFNGCTNLETVVIDEGVKTINYEAFASCGNLTDIYCLATSVPRTNSDAFNNSYIEYATLHVPEESIDSYKNTAPWSSFGTIKAIENEVASINGITYKFDMTKSATVIASANGKYTGNIVIPEMVEYNGVMYNVTTIGEEAFSGCYDLKNVTIGNSVTTIGNSAFYDCTGLTSVTIPNGVTTIGSSAFLYCNGLTSITIPNSVTTIGSSAFQYCSGLTSIVVESGNTNYDSREGCNAIIETATNTLVAGCKNTVIPNSVTTIGHYAFTDCSGLTSITIPNSVTTIGYYAFYGSGWWNNQSDGLIYKDGWLLGYKGNKPSGDIVIANGTKGIANVAFNDCPGLTSITIPNSVTTIGRMAFFGCSNLESVVIGEGIESIESQAFSYCKNLANVYCYATSVPNTNSITFYDSNVASATLHVPEESIDSYKSTEPWSSFGTIKAIENEVELTYEFDATEKTAKVVASKGDSYTGNITIPETVEHNGAVYSVTAIGDIAFLRCSGLTSVTIPNSVTTIGTSAFNGCSDLTSITIPNSVTTIGKWAFSGCTGVTNVTIGNGVTTIETDAFNNCSSLTSIVVESGNTRYDSRDGCNAIIETATNTLITGCKNTVVPESVTAIGDFAFLRCSGLTSVTIPSSVTTIGNSAFYDCTDLTSVTIGNGVNTIGNSAFNGCTGLESVTIPSNVTTLGADAFNNCSGLTSIVVESGNTRYDSREGCNAIIETATNTLITGCKNTVIPESVTEIGAYAFCNCTGLTSISMPNSVTKLGNNAFMNCTGLTSVTIGEGVTTIGDYAFNGCTNLETILISKGVATIAYRAFYNCTGLESIYLTGDVPPTVLSGFTTTQYENAVLYVPEGTLATYQAADVWKEFKNIREFDTTGIDDVYDNNDTHRSNLYYDLQGRAVEHPTRGIYIHNGKKIFIK